VARRTPPAISTRTQSTSVRFALVVRSSRPGIGADVRKSIRDAVPFLVVGPARSLNEVLQQAPTMFLRRYPVFLLGVFAGVALLLACIGIFGVVSYGVARRTREFGIRMAMGALRQDIVRLVLRGSGAPVLVGAVAGLAGAVALGTVFRGLLFGVTSFDPGVLAAVALLLGGVAVISALLPALRAARVDPAVSLRSL
jgi:putative ABC transport system permease protein